MNIEVTQNGQQVLVALDGRLDTTTAPALDKALSTQIENATELVLELAQLRYISSAGLRVLLSAQKAMQKKGSMTLRNVCPEVMEILEMTGFADILVIR